MSKIGNLVGHKPPALTYEISEEWVEPRLPIGIEIEIENPRGRSFDKNKLLTWWRTEQDGSLRDHGFEIVLAVPLFGKDLTNAITAVEAALVGGPWEVNYRTGLHIHLDSRNLEVDELKRIFILYALFERSIFNFVGDNRSLNNFCAPWSRISDHLDTVFSIFEQNTDVRRTLQGVDRYSALNCNSLTKYGSIEFRHMQMTMDFQKIRNWINLLMSLHKASKIGGIYGPQISVEAFIQEAAKGGATEIARRIFPDWFLKFVDDKAIWEGIMLVQDVSVDIAQTARFDKMSNLDRICPHRKQPNRGYIEFMKKIKESA